MARKRHHRRPQFRRLPVSVDAHFLRIDSWVVKGREGLTIYLLHETKEMRLNVLRRNCVPFPTPRRMQLVTIEAKVSDILTHDRGLAAVEVAAVHLHEDPVVDAAAPGPPGHDDSLE